MGIVEMIDGAREGFEFYGALSGDVNDLLQLTISVCQVPQEGGYVPAG